VVSGHDADGRPTREPHLAVVPLADIRHPHADNRLLGFALLLPADLGRDDARYVARVLERRGPGTGVGTDGSDDTIDSFEIVRLGAAGAWQVSRQVRPTLVGLSARRYQGPSRTWASVTPVIYDRVPRRRASLEQIIAESCRRTGLPAPVRIHAAGASAIDCIPPSRAFQCRAKERRPRAHLVLEFPHPVAGPVLLGAGRFHGLGLFVPVEDILIPATSPMEVPAP
jgi:CRISPR-associated protein Csb2